MAATPVAAQDAHYWTNQYGTRGELVGGLVVGSFVDLSATYYNPGAIAFVDQPSLILTTDAWEYQSFDFDDLAPEGLDLRTRRLRPAPSIFAIQLPTRQSKHRFAFSTVTRHRFEVDASARRIPTAQELAESPGRPASSLEANVKNRLTEAWVGFSWAYRLSRLISIGVTTYGAGRNQFGRAQVLSQSVDSVGAGSSARAVREFAYWNARLLWKAGVAIDLRPLTLGAAVTTPSINLFGTGRVLRNDGITELDASDSSVTNELEANFQDGIPSEYNSGAAVAVGAAFRLKATTLYTTAEWFNAVGRYTILKAGSFVGQTTGDTLSSDLTHELRSVVNWGIGLQHEFSEGFQAYGALFSDQSALPKGVPQDNPVAISTWDIWHVSAGGAFVLANIDITLGASYGWGSDTVKKPIVAPGDSPTAEMDYRSIKVIFGFGISF
jgi:hypothetical protein